MPTRLDKTPLPDGVRRLQSVMGSLSRLQTLRCVWTEPDVDRQGIIDATGMALPSVRLALVELEEMGYVTVDQPRGQRNGRRLRYTAAPDRMKNDVEETLRWMSAGKR
jgi:DNA-binding MarR family transcriptional regulator